MLIKRACFWLAITMVMALLSLSLACKKEETANDNTGGGTETKGTAYTSKGDEGTISGKVAFTGTAPEPKKIDMSQDAQCAAKNPNATTEELVVKNGKVENVFVYIKDGTTADGKKIGDFTFPTPSSTVVLDQNGCHYKPHVLGIQTGQKLSITNSDPTTHNIHPTPKVNPEWNQTQAQGAAPIEKTFNRAEILIPVKCNQHPWMKAYIGVMKNPFYAVTKEDGSYEIKNVPPGNYTVVAWQEKGPQEKTMQVTVGPKASATADFTLSGGATASSMQKGSLEVLPALELPMLTNR